MHSTTHDVSLSELANAALCQLLGVDVEEYPTKRDARRRPEEEPEP